MGSHRRSLQRKNDLQMFWGRVGRPDGKTPPKPKKRPWIPHHSSITYVEVKRDQKGSGR